MALRRGYRAGEARSALAEDHGTRRCRGTHGEAPGQHRAVPPAPDRRGGGFGGCLVPPPRGRCMVRRPRGFRWGSSRHASSSRRTPAAPEATASPIRRRWDSSMLTRRLTMRAPASSRPRVVRQGGRASPARVAATAKCRECLEAHSRRPAPTGTPASAASAAVGADRRPGRPHGDPGAGPRSTRRDR